MNIGDTVRFLNSQGGGRVARLEGQLAYVEDEDGFEVPVLQRECVVVASASDALMASTVDAATAPKSASRQPQSKAPAGPAPAAVKAPAPAPEPVEETPEGEKINLLLAFAASDLKRLSDPATTYDAFIVNDSNYFLAYTLASRADEDSAWTPLAQGLIEPNMQEFIVEIEREMLPSMDRVAFQYVAFKQGKLYQLKAPGAVDLKLDTTKFFKLHCFRPSDYFDEPVIELRITTDDRTAGQPAPVDAETLRRNMLEKARADRRTNRRIVKHPAKAVNPDEPIVTDLHIAELVDSTRGLSNADMLNLQIDRFREVMDANIKAKGRKLIFIHGKGEGVLRAAIIKELNYRYKGNDVQDASFREYGFGATQVIIR